MPPDFSNNLTDYEKYRRAFPRRAFDELAARQIGLPGQTILDVGSGTGLIGDGLANIELHLIELDCNEILIRATSRRRNDNRLAFPTRAVVQSVVAKAEECPFSGQLFDGVVVAQSWHWLHRVCAPGEIRRVLKPGNSVGIIYYMHVPMGRDIAGQTERLILKDHPHWRHQNSAGINGQVLRDLQSNGFEKIESLSFDVEELFTVEQWTGYVRTLSICNEMSKPALAKFNFELGDLLQAVEQPFVVMHRLFMAFARTPVV